MENPKFCRRVPWFLLFLSILTIVASLAAGYIGLDADDKWGPFRKALLITGCLGFSFSLLIKSISRIDDYFLSKRPPSSHQPKVTRATERETQEFPSTYISDQSKADHRNAIISWLLANHEAPSTFLILLVVFIFYYGQITAWTFSTVPNDTSTYSQLADAFLEGQTHLITTPPPELANLDNPYSPSERGDIRVTTDNIYYEGKYFLYWGPVPALFTAIWKFITGIEVGDEYITLFSTYIIFIFSLLIILRFKSKYFPSLPRWQVLTGVALIATAHPILWGLSWPVIYPAAIAAGQAFMLGGLFFILPVWERSTTRTWSLILAGLFWGLALGSRLALLGGVGVFTMATIIVLLYTRKNHRNLGHLSKKIAIFISPLAICVLLLGAYNYVRFGNFLDTGYGYLLLGFDTPKFLSEGRIFNLKFLLPNLIYHLFAPFRIQPEFPFVRPIYGDISSFSMLMKRFNFPDNHSVEGLSGIIFTMPAIIFSAWLIFKTICPGLTNPKSIGEVSDQRLRGSDNQSFKFSTVFIFLASVFASIPILLFFHVTVRFHLDFLPMFSLLSVLGMWKFYMESRNYPLRGFLSKLFIILIAVLTIFIGILIALSGADSGFDDQNPVLYKFLVDLFSW